MPKTIQQCNEIKDRRTKQILNTALKLFYEEGFEEVSVDDICKKLRISHGLFYHYFDSKEDIQEKIFEESNIYSKDFELLLSSPVTGIEYIEKINNLTVKMIGHDLLTCYYIYYLIKDGFLNKKESALNRIEFKALKKVLQAIKDGQEKRRITPGNPNYLFTIYISSLYGVASLKMKSKKKEIYDVPTEDVFMNIFYRKERNSL